MAPNLLGIVALVCLLKALDGLSDLYALTLQLHGQYHAVLTLAAVRTAVYLIPTALALVLWRNLVLALFITAVASGVFVLARNRSLAHRLERAHPVTGPGEAANGWHRAMTSGLQVGAGDAIASLATAIPQYLLSYYLGAAALVPVTYATYILVAIEMVLNARILIWMKRAQQQRQPVVGGVRPDARYRFPFGRTRDTWGDSPPQGPEPGAPIYGAVGVGSRSRSGRCPPGCIPCQRRATEEEQVSLDHRGFRCRGRRALPVRRAHHSAVGSDRRTADCYVWSGGSVVRSAHSGQGVAAGNLNAGARG